MKTIKTALRSCPVQLDYSPKHGSIMCWGAPRYHIVSQHTLAIYCPECERNGRITRVSVTSSLPRFPFTQAVENLWDALGELVGPFPEKHS